MVEKKLKPGLYVFDKKGVSMVKDRSYFHWHDGLFALNYVRGRPDSDPPELDQKIGPKCMAFW